ncbi:hypothetical protein D0Z00_001476 [Geotrichum galactomycetum]|uniref:Uncharacterized protein n=1 Tax=Geotrichum galactomycetum TaxID=27317 RepID=A0ACB6V704_9ASCO|nr:hypothetical protein D0Z00_001476 [Geotrichum candidum]
MAPGKFTIPGLLEPVMVKKWYLNTTHIRRVVAHHRSVVNSHLLELTADIPLVEADLSESSPYRIGAAQLGLKGSRIDAKVAAATGGVDNGMAAFEWISNVYNEAYAVESGVDVDYGAPMPIVVDNTGGASVTEKLYLLCALLLPTRALKRSPLIVLDQELRSTVAANLALLRARADLTLDGLRSTLAETFGNQHAAASALSNVSVRENMNILQLLYSLMQHLRGVAGVTMPLRAPLATGSSAATVAAAVKPYEKSTLDKLLQLHREFVSLFSVTDHNPAGFDLRAAKRIVDEAVLTVAVRWAPFAHIDQRYEFNPTHSGNARASYERALAYTAITMRIFRMLYGFIYPLWPDLSRSLAHRFELQFKTSVLLSPAVSAPEAAVLSELTITKGDLAVFDNHVRILEAINRVVSPEPRKTTPANSKLEGAHDLSKDLSPARVPRHHYRGYLCVQDATTGLLPALGAGASSRAAANAGPVLLLKRVADVGLLTVPNASTIFNTGNLETTQITPQVQLRAFDARGWTPTAIPTKASS